jgi:hypothetical protein
MSDSPENNLWSVPDADPVGDLQAWARMIAEKSPGNIPHRHGPFFVSQIERAKEKGEKLMCPGCGTQVEVR